MAEVQLRQALKAALDESELTPATLSRRIGRGKDYIADFLNGRKDSLKPNDISKIERTLDTVLIDSQHGDSRQPPDVSKPLRLARKSLTGTVRRYNLAYTGGGTFEMGDDFEEVHAPPSVAGIERAYACYVHGHAMEPALYAGDTVFCHPFKPVRINDLVLIQMRPDPGGHSRWLVAQYRGEDLSSYQFHRFCPQEDLAIERGAIESVDKIVTIDKA